MNTLASLTLTALLISPICAKSPQPIPQNTSRKLVNAFEEAIYKTATQPSKKRPSTALGKVQISIPGNHWKTSWQTSKSGTTLITHYKPKNDANRLALGHARILISTQPFKETLKQAPAVMDQGAAIEFEIHRWLPQKWVTRDIPGLKRKIRCYMDTQSGGADNASYSTEPFPIKTKDGTELWIVIQVEHGHKKEGLSLQKALNGLPPQ